MFCPRNGIIMKKTFTIILLTLILFQTIGGYLVFEVKRYMAWHEMHSTISSGHYTVSLFSFPENQLPAGYKYTGKNEFEVSGKLYDIVKKGNRDGYTIIYCIHDAKEEVINTTLQKMFQDKLKLILLSIFSVQANLPSESRMRSDDFCIYRFPLPVYSVEDGFLDRCIQPPEIFSSLL
jgi:hypothetical protein